MNLVERVQKILLHPKAEWSVIEAEQTDPQTLYTRYIAILALIPAVAGFISAALFMPIGFGFALGASLMHYVLSLVMVFVVAFIADLLAPGFDGRKSLPQALKLTAYAMTAAWVAGVFLIVPLIGWIVSFLGTLYSLYLFFLGVPVMMKVPGPKTPAYTVVVILVAIITGFIVGMIHAAILGMGMVGMTGGMH